jgi:ubiquitin-protein ligase E3 B
VSNQTFRQDLLKHMEGEASVFLLSNMVDIFANTSKVTSLDDNVFLSAFIHLLRHCKSFVVSPSDPATIKTASSKYHAIFGWFTGKSVENVPPNHLQRLLDILAYLWSRPFLNKLLKPILELSPSASTPVPDTSVGFKFRSPRTSSISSSRQELITNLSLYLLTISNLILLLCETLAPSKSAILSSVGFTPGFVPAMWRVIVEMGPGQDGVSLFLKASKEPSKEPFMVVLQLFCDLASRLFLTLDEEQVSSSRDRNWT